MRLIFLFTWMLVPVTALAGGNALGKPFMLWSYTYSDFGPPGKLSSRYYKTCTYVGWKYEHITVPAKNGRCPLIHINKPAKD